MAVTHPLLKELKAYVIKFCAESSDEEGSKITDSHPGLFPFCRKLEDVLVTGLRYYSRDDGAPWKWAKILGDIYPTFKLTAPVRWCIDETAGCKHVLTDIGRTRLFLRCALKKGVLALVVRLLKEEKKLLASFYDCGRSIIGDEILFELFASMVAPLARCQFSLFIRNSSFLDETWELPVYMLYELVPTERLGVGIVLVRGRVIVTEVEPGSVADEDAKIEPGDIIDYLYGECMRNAGKRKFVRLLREYRGAPVYIGVVKAIGRGESFFKPLIPLLSEAGLALGPILARRSKRERELALENRHLELLGCGGCESGAVAERMERMALKEDCCSSAELEAEAENAAGGGQQRNGQLVDEKGHYPVLYLGEAKVGATGTIDKIERGVIQVVGRYNSSTWGEEREVKKRPVLVDLGETDVLVACELTRQPLFQHGYPEIGSCGRRVDYPLHFAYVAGETTCTLASEFTCYVFQANSEEQAKIILKEIARGFERTHWAV